MFPASRLKQRGVGLNKVHPGWRAERGERPESRAEREDGGPERLTGVGGGVLGVVLQLVDVHLHPRLGGALHQAVDVLPRQSQRQTLAAATC